MAQPQVMLHGWFPPSCIFQGLTSGSQGLPASCSSALGHIAKVPFLGEYLSLQVCMIIRKLVKVEQRRSVLAVSQGCVQPSCWDVATGKHKPSRDSKAEKRGHGLMSNWEEVTVSFSSNWKQVVSVLNHWNISFLGLNNLDMSETTVSGPCSSLKFSVIWLSGLIVDKVMTLRRSREVELPGPVAMQELPLKGKSLEGEEEKPLSSYQADVQIDWYRQKILKTPLLKSYFRHIHCQRLTSGGLSK